jgi:hypothetical protein
LKKRIKRSQLPRSEGDTHLDNLLDEALKDTFPASDPIAITIDQRTGGVALDSADGLDDLSIVACVQEAAESSLPPLAGFVGVNLWAMRQISSYYFGWWWLLLGGRK